MNFRKLCKEWQKNPPEITVDTNSDGSLVVEFSAENPAYSFESQIPFDWDDLLGTAKDQIKENPEHPIDAIIECASEMGTDAGYDVDADVRTNMDGVGPDDELPDDIMADLCSEITMYLQDFLKEKLGYIDQH